MENLVPSSDEKESIGERVPLVSIIVRATCNSENA